MKPNIDFNRLAIDVKRWGAELGFEQVGICDAELGADRDRLQSWLAQSRHGEMHYMARHGSKRTQPDELVPGTLRVISVRMDYMPESLEECEQALADSGFAYVSRYAVGRDYHKLMRRRLQRLAERIETQVGSFGYRAFVDSAPVMEKALARNAGLGWIGKHTNLINKQAGSWFFLGELYTDLRLPTDDPADDHCGSCRACLDVCPTDAIVAPYQLDARRCISYLTIELQGSIPVEFRAAMGNRIYGCDDCQLVCPWNKFAGTTGEADFFPRHQLNASRLLELFAWSEDEWAKRTEGSAIRRIGYESWLRNLAVALGNAPYTMEVERALSVRLDHTSAIVREHVRWALDQQATRRSNDVQRH